MDLLTISITLTAFFYIVFTFIYYIKKRKVFGNSLLTIVAMFLIFLHGLICIINGFKITELNKSLNFIVSSVGVVIPSQFNRFL